MIMVIHALLHRVFPLTFFFYEIAFSNVNKPSGSGFHNTLWNLIATSIMNANISYDQTTLSIILAFFFLTVF